MRRILTTAAAIAAIGAVAAGAASAGPGKTLVIRHQLQGCHAWAFAGGVYKPAQTIRLKAGSTLTVVDNDLMPHTLVQVAGPRVKYIGKPAMSHPASSVKVTFPKAGVYRFTTKAGEDYVAGVKTIGADNVLTLKVVVA